MYAHNENSEKNAVRSLEGEISNPYTSFWDAVFSPEGLIKTLHVLATILIVFGIIAGVVIFAEMGFVETYGSRYDEISWLGLCFALGAVLQGFLGALFLNVVVVIIRTLLDIKKNTTRLPEAGEEAAGEEEAIDSQQSVEKEECIDADASECAPIEQEEPIDVDPMDTLAENPSAEEAVQEAFPAVHTRPALALSQEPETGPDEVIDRDAGQKQAGSPSADGPNQNAISVPMDQSTVLAILKDDLRNADMHTRERAIRSLREMGTAALPVLEEALRNPDTFVRHSAAEALGELGSEAAAAIRGLEKRLLDGNKKVRAAAQEAIERIRAGM